MICDYGNMTKEVVMPLISACGTRSGGKLLNIVYTQNDLYIFLTFIGVLISLIGITVIWIKDIDKRENDAVSEESE